MKHKFKLKRDSKVVGYCEWTEDWGWKYSFSATDFKDTFTHFAVAQTPKGITAHPFVCLDKNREEVYANDPIHYQGKNYPEGFSWNESSLAWDLHDGYFHTHYGAAGTGGEDDYFDIELIEDS